MPELPDVEHYRRVVDDHMIGRTISRIEAPDPSVLRNCGPAALGRQLHGRRFIGAERRGKWLIVATSGPTIMFHFGMTGSLEWSPGRNHRHLHTRVVFVTSVGELRYRDQRKLRGIWLAHTPEAVSAIIGTQGPDALDLTATDLRRALWGRHRAIKTVLMDQSVVAGLGNMLTDEILWRARVHPDRDADALDIGQVLRLHRSLQSVLRRAVAAGRIPRTRSWLSGARDTTAPRCPRCLTPLRDSRIAGRRSLWCPQCQPSSTST
ncbi:MAG: formamidopyrimidine-DNA glycosylase, partial [Acidimicrobiaceae bacterium]|nr:formamidopyrimidine-DNA glycosylase [Acidimicrobiaceae bacterium]